MDINFLLKELYIESFFIDETAFLWLNTSETKRFPLCENIRNLKVSFDPKRYHEKEVN